MHDGAAASAAERDARGLLPGLIRDGRPLLTLVALALLFSGAFALFLSAVRQFLPHDVAFLQVSAEELCRVANCRVVAFMFHDRVAFGGALITIGTLYLWLVEFPLRRGEAWAWWALAASGTLGFLSFLAYIGYGYLDMWHAVGTVVLLPCFIAGLARSRHRVRAPRGWRAMLVPGSTAGLRTPFGVGRACLLATAAGMVAGGATILLVGMTQVFVAQDLMFMGVTRAELHAVNPKLIPLIAHDRAGFGGALVSCGILVASCAWCGRPGRSLWQALAIAGVAGFGCAIGVHLLVGYIDLVHLAPAIVGAVFFTLGTVLCAPRMLAGRPVLTPRGIGPPTRSGRQHA